VEIRAATEADLALVLELWDEFAGDGTPAWAPDARAETADELARAVREGVVVVLEDEGQPLGFASGLARNARLGEVMDLYVRPRARRRGAGTRLLHAVVRNLRERGAEFVAVSVDPDNAVARGLYERGGFRPEQLRLVGAADEVEARLAREPGGETFGSIHVQTDDEPAVERAVRQFVPRLPGGSRGSVVAPPRNGWIAVYDDVCDRDPRQLNRLARELSDRLGAVVVAFGVEGGDVVRYALLDRGTVMDEYVSVPEHAGPLPPGEVVALMANPRVAARLTGADPERVRAAARQAAAARELPPARELLEDVAAALGIEGAGHGWADAPALPGMRAVER
jgi:ribosomal protein S18 acetylase RimI-like enzyme